MNDPVESPDHYTWHVACECNDIAQEFNYNIGTALKYLWRYQHKGNPIQDLRKAVKKIKQEIERLEHEETRKTTKRVETKVIIDGRPQACFVSED